MLDDLRSDPPLFVASGRAGGSEIHDSGDEESDEVSVRRQLFFGYSA